MKHAIILGTRPEIIKMSPVVREFNRRRFDYFLLHTGQHYSYEMDKIFFEEIGLEEPKYNLNVGSGSHGKQTGEILIGIEKILLMEKPDTVLVEGDTNSVLAGALAASKMRIKVGHVEAGLRSYDRNMPEEINRILADHCSDCLFAPTEKSREILLGEGISGEKIHVTGNTIVDAVKQNLKLANKKADALKELGLKPKKYFLVTSHRQENVDVKERLKGILKGLEKMSELHSMPVIFPIHPRTAKMISEFGLKHEGIRLTDPVGYLKFLQLEANARLVLTDSGGVQEEACVLKVPCVTLRDNTERPETVEAGANMLAGASPEKIVICAKKMMERKAEWTNPLGDGNAGTKIATIIEAQR